MNQNDIENDSGAELYMTPETEQSEVVDFVEARLANPAVIGDVVVWNFHNASLEAQPLLDWARDAESGVYVVAYQIPGVWAFMSRILPNEVSNARLLAYRQSSDRYVDYENWNAQSGCEVAHAMRRLDERLDAIAEELPNGVAW